MKKTPWFPPDVKPCSDSGHIGIYETKVRTLWGNMTRRLKWRGDLWAEMSDSPVFYQRRHWRGLAEKPKGE